MMQVTRDPATDRVYDESVEVDEGRSMSLAQTKMEQVRMEVEVEGLVKNCEDLLGLTRVCKEGWVLGGLETVKKGGEGRGDEAEWREVRRGMEGWLRGYFERRSKEADEVKETAEDG